MINFGGEQIKAKDEASAKRLESLINGCRDFALSSAVSTCHTYRTVRSLDKNNGVTTFVVFEEWVIISFCLKNT